MRAYQEREENMAAEQDLKDTDCTRGEGRTKGRNPRRKEDQPSRSKTGLLQT
jgi:hypothetical protein